MPALAGLARRDGILIAGLVGLLTALAWAYLIHLDRQMSSAAEYDRISARRLPDGWTASGSSCSDSRPKP